MQLDIFPTDSLYKFCAILGLSLIVFNTYYNFEMLSDSRVKTLKLEIEVNKFKQDSIRLINEVKDLNNKLTTAENQSKKGIKIARKTRKAFFEGKGRKREFEKLLVSSNSILADNIKLQKEIDSLLTNIKNENRFLNYKLIELSSQKKLLNEEKGKSNLYSVFLKIGIPIGFIISIYGFFNWRLIQKKLDDKI